MNKQRRLIRCDRAAAVSRAWPLHTDEIDNPNALQHKQHSNPTAMKLARNYNRTKERCRGVVIAAIAHTPDGRVRTLHKFIDRREDMHANLQISQQRSCIPGKEHCRGHSSTQDNRRSSDLCVRHSQKKNNHHDGQQRRRAGLLPTKDADRPDTSLRESSCKGPFLRREDESK